MSKLNKVTIKDVAKHAGVGLGTVSRAINDSSEISLDTKRKVMRSIELLGYVPDPVAQSMRSQKYRNIAYFVSDISNAIYSRIAKGIQNVLEGKGYNLIICDTGGDNLADKVYSSISGRKLDGIILSLPREDDEALNRILIESGLPVVTLNREIPGIPPGVLVDNYNGVKKAVTYLLSLGHKGIALLVSGMNIRPTRDSLDGYKDAFQSFGIPCPERLIIHGGLTFEFGKEAIFQLLPQILSGEVTAAITLDHNIFKGILRAMRDHHIEYPKHLSIICGDDSELTQLLVPSVTVIDRNSYDIGRKGAEMLLNYLGQPSENECSSCLIGTDLVIRDSCRRLT